MSNFHLLAAAADMQFQMMAQHPLFIVSADKDEFYELYLNSFPAGKNEIFRERRAYDCTNDRQWLKELGLVVALINGKLVSIWDMDYKDGKDGYYEPVIEALREYVHSKSVDTCYLRHAPYGAKVSTPTSKDNYEEGLVWHHYHSMIPRHLMSHDKATQCGKVRTKIQTATRALMEIDFDSINTVLELIDSDAIYRGAEHRKTVQDFRDAKQKFDKAENKEVFVLSTLNTTVPFFRNSVIGTLVTDVANGVPLEEAVKIFESKVAPANYKRSKSLVTPRMIEDATKTIRTLGFENSLARRHATTTDVSINDVLFADSSAQAEMKDSLDDIMGTLPTKSAVKPTKQTKEIGINEFLKEILPKANTIKAYVENTHKSNLVNVTAPVDMEAPNILKWGNPFSWAYNGNVTDSLRERVQQAGGRIDGVFRFTHSWNELERNESLMDLHVFFPGNDHKDGVHDNYGNKRRVGWNHRSELSTGGVQDVDYTNQAPVNFVPVENITFPTLSRLPEGTYKCKIHNWQYRNSTGKGKAQIEILGVVYDYIYPALKHKEWITVAEVTLKDGVFSINHKLDMSTQSSETWGIKTHDWVDVDMVMLSPNYWETGNKEGNQHTFFILKDCKNPEDVRSIYNEYLVGQLHDHRKVFEILGSKLVTPYDEQQLAGLGFSSTQRNSITLQVRGEINGNYKVTF